jgi:flagellar hook-basal body complex protein FliE
MMDELTLRSRLQSLQPTEFGKKADGKEGDGPSFQDVLKQTLSEVNSLQADADRTMADLQLGKDVDIHEAMIALNKMDTSFKMMMEVRNKLLKAYDELMRVQV